MQCDFVTSQLVVVRVVELGEVVVVERVRDVTSDRVHAQDDVSGALRQHDDRC